eukprot:Nk52_evm28s239 gene=Nk52_evmTU28s239
MEEGEEGEQQPDRGNLPPGRRRTVISDMVPMVSHPSSVRPSQGGTTMDSNSFAGMDLSVLEEEVARLVVDEIILGAIDVIVSGLSASPLSNVHNTKKHEGGQ